MNSVPAADRALAAAPLPAPSIEGLEAPLAWPEGALGLHLLADLHGCDPARLNDLPALRAALLAAVAGVGGTIVTDVFHAFAPQGLSGVVVIAESHAAVHTWPEHGKASLDVFSCTPRLDLAALLAALAVALGAARVSAQAVARGVTSP